MFKDAYPPVNEIGVISLESVEQPYIGPASTSVPVPGEDGEPQSVSQIIFDCCLGLAALGALFAVRPLLQAYTP